MTSLSDCGHTPGPWMHVFSRQSLFLIFCLFTAIKGAVSRYSVIFALFCASKKWRLLAQVSRTSDLAESLAVRAAWQPGHLCWLLTWQCGEPTTSRAGVALLHLSTATSSTFVFRLRGPSKVISPSSRFKISSDSYRYRFFILVFGSAHLPKLASAISSPNRMGDWEKESAVWL